MKFLGTYSVGNVRTSPAGIQGATGPAGGGGGGGGFSATGVTGAMVWTTTSAAGFTGVPWAFALPQNAMATVGAQVQATNGNGMSGMMETDIQGTVVRGASGTAILGQNTQASLRSTLQASGWAAVIQPTGIGYVVVVSTPNPSAGITGNVNWSLLLQHNEKDFP